MIAEKVYNLDSFKRQYEALLILSVCDTIPQLVWEEDKQSLLAKIDWNNLLSIASILSYSPESSHLDAALRLAQTCLTQDSCSEIQKNASAVVLDSLTNKLAIKMAKDKKYLNPDYEKIIPLHLNYRDLRLILSIQLLLKTK